MRPISKFYAAMPEKKAAAIYCRRPIKDFAS